MSLKCDQCNGEYPGEDALTRHDCPAIDAEVVFEEPPTRRANALKYQFTETKQKVLKLRPAEWARIFIIESKSGSAGVKKRLEKEFDNGDWEFRSGPFVGGSAVWARWMGHEVTGKRR